jgi:hypothetical protein
MLRSDAPKQVLEGIAAVALPFNFKAVSRTERGWSAAACFGMSRQAQAMPNPDGLRLGSVIDVTASPPAPKSGAGRS